MLIKDCQDCKYCQRMIALGLGVRCSNELNQKYKTRNDSLIVVISEIPECNLFEDRRQR